MPILETERLVLRELTLTDTDFILELLNTPGWLSHIGDKQVKDADAARNYLLTGPLLSYKDRGYGLWAVALKDSHKLIGMCGLFKRDTMDDIEIGYALLPGYESKGYAFEAASATIVHAGKLKIPRIVAITTTDNEVSKKLLGKIGFQFEKMFRLRGDAEELMLFAKSTT